MRVFIHFAAFAAAIMGNVSANALVNSGFESPFGIPSGPDDGWYYVSESIDRDCGESHSGQCSAMLASDPLDRLRDVLWQDLQTIPGEQYSLSFFYKTNRNTDRGATDPFSQGRFAFNPPSGLSGHGFPVANTFTGNGSWQRYETVFTAAGTSSRIAFAGLGYSNGRIGNLINIDDVALAAVPEPATVAMLLTGLAALTWRRYRTSRAARCQV